MLGANKNKSIISLEETHEHFVYGRAADSAAMVAAATVSAQETIRLRIASGHPPVNTYVNLMQNFFVPEVTKRVAERTKHKVEFVEGYGGAMVKVADTLEGVQSGIIDIGGYCFCFEPSNLPLHAFQIMLPFGTMGPVKSLKVARAVYDKVPYMSKVFEDKYRQKLIALIADNGYNLGTNFEWNKVADLKGQKIAGAGLNLKWLEFAGATPVQSSLADAYTVDADRRVQRLDHVPVRLGQLQALRGRQVLHRDRLRRDHLARPDHQFGALGQAAERGAGHHPGSRQGVRGEDRHGERGELSEAARRPEGARAPTCARCRDKVRAGLGEVARGLAEAEGPGTRRQGLPGTQVLETALEAAEKNGHKWPVRYSVK